MGAFEFGTLRHSHVQIAEITWLDEEAGFTRRNTVLFWTRLS